MYAAFPRADYYAPTDFPGGIGLSYGSRLPTSTVLTIHPGISRVLTVGLKRDAVGGVF